MENEKKEEEKIELLTDPKKPLASYVFKLEENKYG